MFGNNGSAHVKEIFPSTVSAQLRTVKILPVNAQFSFAVGSAF